MNSKIITIQYSIYILEQTNYLYSVYNAQNLINIQGNIINNKIPHQMQEERRSITKRTSMGSYRSRSSDRDYDSNILDQFKNRVARHSDFIYVMSIQDQKKKQNRGSDILSGFDELTPFKNRKTDSINNNASKEISFVPIKMLDEPIVCELPNRQQYQLNQHSCQCYKKCEKNQCCCYLFIEPCEEGKCCIGCIQLKNQLLKIKPPSLSDPVLCTCKKTKCLKLYCQCFAKKSFCSPRCQCEDCMNREDTIQRIKAIGQAARPENQEKGCQCKKTKCQKKYCKCYSVGQKCTKFCTCQNCNNMDEELRLIRKKKQDLNRMQEQPLYNQLQQLPTQMEFDQPDFSGIRFS